MNNTESVPQKQELFIIAKGAGIVFFGTVAGSGLRYLFEIIVARNLGPELLGLFFLGLAVYRVAGTLAELGLPNGIVRYVAIFHGRRDNERTKGVIFSAIKFGTLSGLAVAFLLFAFSKSLALDFFHEMGLMPLLRLFALIIPFTTAATMMLFATQGFRLMGYSILVREIFEPSGRVIVVIVLLILGWKLRAVAFSYLIVTVLGSFLALYYLQNTFPQIIRKKLQPIYETRKIFAFSWPLLFAQFFSLLNLWVDTIMLGHLATPTEVGIYSAAHRTALLGTLLILSFRAIFAPIVSDLYDKKEFVALNSYFKTVAKWMFTLNFPIFFLMIFFAKPIISIFGSDFMSGHKSLMILSVGWLILSATGLAGNFLTMTGRSKLNLINVSFMLATNIILNLLLIPKYGMWGAAVATALAISSVNILALIELKAIYNIHPYRLDFVKPLIAGGVSGVALYLCMGHVWLNHSYLLILSGSVIFIISYVFTLMLLGLDKEDEMIFSKIKGRFSC